MNIICKAHLGLEWTLSALCENFWIIRGRVLIKKNKTSCVICKKLYGKPKVQKMADLPEERCQPNKHDKQPFTYVGIYVFGPFYVKYDRGQIKRYGCIFTCFTTSILKCYFLSELTSSWMVLFGFVHAETTVSIFGLTMGLTWLGLRQSLRNAYVS